MSTDAYFEGAEGLFYVAKHDQINGLLLEGAQSSLFPLVHSEVQRVVDFVRSARPSEPLHQVLRSRMEYLLLVVHKLLRFEGAAAGLGSNAFCLLFELFKSIESRMNTGDQSDDESGASESMFAGSNVAVLASINHATGSGGDTGADPELSLGPSRTPWLDMCLVSLSLACAQFLRQMPSVWSELGLGLADSVALGQSAHWPVQYVAVALVQAQILHEMQCDEDELRTSNNAAEAGRDGAPAGASKSRSSSPSASQDASAAAQASSGESTKALRKSDSTNRLSSNKSVKAGTAKPGPASDDRARRSESGKVALSSSMTSLGSTVGGGSSTRVSNSAGNGVAAQLETEAADSERGSASLQQGIAASSGSARVRSTAAGAEARRAGVGGAVPTPMMRRAQSSAGGGGLSFRARSLGGRALRCVDEICKSGYLRTMVWLLMHAHEVVRKAAAEVIKTIIALAGSHGGKESGNLSSSSSSDPGASAVVSDMWACCVEQGLVPHLEYVRQGVPVYQRSSRADKGKVVISQPLRYFPEDSIRSLAESLLERVAREVVAQPALYARLTGALVHSGNAKLRVNILSGLMCLSGRAPALGRLLCSSVEAVPDAGTASSSTSGSRKDPPSSSGRSTKGSLPAYNSNNNSGTMSASARLPPASLDSRTPRKTMLFDMLSAVVRDPAETRGFLALLLHFLESCLAAQSLSVRNIGNEIATQTDSKTLGSVASRSVPGTIEPMVLIRDVSRTTKMICPSLKTIEQHSAGLHKMLMEATERQITVAMQLLHGQGDAAALGAQGLEGKLQGVLKGLDDAHFVTLQGSYNIWQEVFSHMTDDYLLETSVDHMSTLGVVEALQITAQFGMRQLGLKYSEALARRLTVENFLQVFLSSVGVYVPSKAGVSGPVALEDAPLRLHLLQTVHCLRFLSTHLERIVTIWKPKDTAVIVDALHRVLMCFFLVQENAC